MARGDGINKRGKRWVATAYDPRTKQKAHVGTFDSYAEARDAKRLFEATGKGRAKTVETCDSFAARWMRDYGAGRKESTRIHNEERVRAFARDFAGRPLDSVAQIEARAWIQGGQVPDLIADTARRWEGAEARGGKVFVPAHKGNLSAVRAMFTDARELGVAVNPFGGLKVAQSRGRRDIIVLELAEVDALVRMAVEKWGDYVAPACLIAAAAWTGMRPGELYALRKDRVDLKAGVVRVVTAYSTRARVEQDPKTRAGTREIHLLPAARDAFRRAMAQARGEFVFETPRGRHYTGRTHFYYWDPVRTAFWATLDARRRREIPVDFDFYDLRHFYGTMLARRGASPYVIANQMGHDDGGKLAMERYIHLAGQDARSEVERLFRDEDADAASG